MDIEKIFGLIKDMEPLADKNDPLYKMLHSIERSVYEENSFDDELDLSELELISAAGDPSLADKDKNDL